MTAPAHADADLLEPFTRRFELRVGSAAQAEPLHRFIRRNFEAAHGARIAHFLPRLIGLHERGGGLVAAFGTRAAASGPLFLERYLDAPVEQTIGARFGLPVRRDEVVEVGNLAATHVGATRWLILAVNLLLHHEGFRWITFTATPMVRNALHRLELRPVPLREARIERLPEDERAQWGDYYARGPVVMTGELGHGYRTLLANRELHRRLRAPLRRAPAGEGA